VSRQWDLVVPVKALPLAKSRMHSLPGRDRSRLMLAMVTDALVAMTSSEMVHAVYVVTTDPEVISLATRLRAMIVPDPGQGLNAAICCGAWHARVARPDAAVAALTGDLPALRADALDRALAGAARLRSALVVDASGAGTTLLTAGPGVTLNPRFGEGSARRHQAAGAVPLSEPDLHALRQDVDTMADLDAACLLGVGEATSRYVSQARSSWARLPERAGVERGCPSRADELAALS
jgi:2-phospho-L-lactate/phosphoenolpyruvate guanylyltransferase